MSKATDNLRDHQQQLDEYGVMVGVSRQAIEEVLAEHAVMLAALIQATSRADKDLKKKFRGRTDECSRDYAMCVDAITKASNSPAHTESAGQK